MRGLAREWFGVLAAEVDGVLPTPPAVAALVTALRETSATLGEPMASDTYRAAGVEWSRERGRCYICLSVAPCACGTPRAPLQPQARPAPGRARSTRQSGELF